ncbi:hypothetical protein ACEPAH_8897 [Sanghuangporus vaninii]
MAQSVRGRSSSISSSSNSNNSREDKDALGEEEAPKERMEVDADVASVAPAVAGMARAASGQECPPESQGETEEEGGEGWGPWWPKAVGDQFPALSDEARAERPELYCAGRWVGSCGTLVALATGEAKDATRGLAKAAQSEVERLRRVMAKVAVRREEEAHEEVKRSAARLEEEAKASFLERLTTFRGEAPEVVVAFCRLKGRDAAGNLVKAAHTSTKTKVQLRPVAREATGKMITLTGSSVPGVGAAGSGSETPRGGLVPGGGQIARWGCVKTLTGKAVILSEDESDEGEVTVKGPARMEVLSLPKRVREPAVEAPVKCARALGAAPSIAVRVEEEGWRGGEESEGGWELEKVARLPCHWFGTQIPVARGVLDTLSVVLWVAPGTWFLAGAPQFSAACRVQDGWGVRRRPARSSDSQ